MKKSEEPDIEWHQCLDRIAALADVAEDARKMARHLAEYANPCLIEAGEWMLQASECLTRAEVKFRGAMSYLVFETRRDHERKLKSQKPKDELNEAQK